MFKVVAKQQLTQEGYNVDNMQFFADKRVKKLTRYTTKNQFCL